MIRFAPHFSETRILKKYKREKENYAASLEEKIVSACSNKTKDPNKLRYYVKYKSQKHGNFLKNVYGQLLIFF